MKPSNFISELDHLLKVNIHIAWQIACGLAALVLASFPLYFSGFTASLWYVPVLSVGFFVLALIGTDFMPVSLKPDKVNSELDDIENEGSVIVTRFGKETLATNNEAKSAA